MTTPQHPAPEKRGQAAPAKPTEAQEYLDSVMDSWQSMGYMLRNGQDMLTTNLAMTPDNAKVAFDEWLKSKGVKR